MIYKGPWERITHRGELVYWRRELVDGRWLAVRKDGDRWRWAIHSKPGSAPDAYGHRRQMANARTTAEQHIRDEQSV